MKTIVLLHWILLSAAVSLVEEGPFVYVDWQESPYVGGLFDHLYQPANSVKGPIQHDDFATGLQGILDTIAHARGTRVRAFGSKWTFNNMSYVNESMVDSTGLNYCQIGMNSSYLKDPFVELADRLVFVQAGVRIKELNRALTDKRLALFTSGASDGQRIAGALSTGTHGSRFEYGGMEQMIRAIHIVTHGDRHVLLQGEAVVNQEFATYLGGATLIQDEKLFNAAKVCFGSCGIIHGYVLQAEPLYLLRKLTKKYSYAEISDTLNTLDVSGLEGIRDTFTHPSIISVTLNPFDRGADSAFVTVMDQVPLEGQRFLQENKAAVNVVLWGILELLVRFMNNPWVRRFDKFFFGGALRYAICRIISSQALAIGTGKVDVIETNIPSRTFGNPDTEDSTDSYPDIPYNTTDLEICVPLERTTDALNVLDSLLRDDPIPIFLTLRFVKKSSSTLGFAKFDTSTTVEVTTLQDEDLWSLTGDWLERLFEEFETAGIPHSYHWGKRFPLNSRWVSNAYGDDLTEWEEQRRILLGENAAMFRNDVLDQLGIS